MKQSFIYALTYGNKTKIGFSADPNRRFNALCSQAGIKKEEALFSKYATINPRVVEKDCHAMAGEKYIREAGEWFSCSHAQAISIIIANVVGGEIEVEENPRLNKLISDIKTSLTAGVCSVISSDFNFSETDFGDITTIKIDDSNWFILGEVMSIAGYLSSPSSLISSLKIDFNSAGINPEFHKKIKVATSSGIKESIIINEMALFEILSFSRSENAIKFRSWMIQNILCGVVKW